jgi:hypothetical protein
MSASHSRSYVVTGLWLLAGVLIYLSLGYTEMQGSDLWWHIAAGREIIQNQTLWIADSWSFTAAGESWINHEWLADLIYYGWVSLFDLASLVYWKWLVVLSTYLLLQYSLFKTTGQPAAALLCAGVAAMVAAPFIDVRPHLYSLLGFSVLVALLLNRTAAIWKLILLFVIWANLHGGFIFGLMALGILVFPWNNVSLEALTRPFKIMVFCTLACLINPDGINSFLLPMSYALDSSSPYRQLGEWLPPFQAGGIQSPLFIWALSAAPVIALSYLIPAVRKNTGIPWSALVLALLTLLMSLTSRRFIPLFAISLAVMSAPLLGFLLDRVKAEKAGLLLVVLALVYGGYRMQPYPLSSGTAYHYLTAEYSYPIDTLNYVEANNLRGNVFALYNWGGFIHWRTDGKLKVFIDGRANTVYTDETYNQYVSVLRGVEGWQSFVESIDADYFLWPYHQYGGMAKLQAMLTSGRWKAIYQDSESFLLARTDTVLPSPSKPSAKTPYRLLGAARVAAFRGDWAMAAQHASGVIEQIPYQRSACNLAAQANRQLGNVEKAKQILNGCLDYFPSRQLR